jgi:broad specificity phosphatase PhoE
LLLGICLALPALVSKSIAASEPPPVDAELLKQLQQGGFIIYFRHAATEVVAGADGSEDLARCDSQRNLSALGREQAAAIGVAFAALRIPVGTVYSSPYCRCKDTARLAFGRYAVRADLRFAIDVSAAQRQRLAAALKDMLSEAPREGGNTVIVAHSANMREAAGLWPKPEGTAYVVRPLGGGRFEALARMTAEEWSTLAARAGQRRPGMASVP